MVTKEEYIKVITEADNWLADVKPWFDEHEGQEVTNPWDIKLIEVTRQVMKNQIIIKQLLLDEYGVTVMTKVSP